MRWLIRVALLLTLISTAALVAALPPHQASMTPGIPRSGIFPLPSAILSQMVYVPAGTFTMGSPPNQGLEDEQPRHFVWLDAFWIDQTEVTNSAYQSCVTAGVCNPDHLAISFSWLDYYGEVRFHNYPVIYVSWAEAYTYCAWAGKRLPTEAEWEKAARGADSRPYPWGDHEDPAKANFGGLLGDVTTVGSFPSGNSPYGASDMTGNVEEWVADWYSADYYARSPTENPPGPSSGEYRVVRGGSWAFYQDDVRSTYRGWAAPGAQNETIGFRCAKDAY